jgi:hypothetical protein
MDKNEKYQHHRDEEIKEDILRERSQAWWKGCMNSQLKKMSCGAQRIARCMSWARGENWRRKESQKKGK